MELLKANYINTTTAIVVGSNTDSAKYIIEPDPLFQYVSSGFNNDSTTATLRINFSETLTVSRIGLVGINLKAFDLYYNGATASTFALTTTAATTASTWLFGDFNTTGGFLQNPVSKKLYTYHRHERGRAPIV